MSPRSSEGTMDRIMQFQTYDTCTTQRAHQRFGRDGKLVAGCEWTGSGRIVQNQLHMTRSPHSGLIMVRLRGKRSVIVNAQDGKLICGTSGSPCTRPEVMLLTSFGP